jgi:hypothetical protein
MDDKAVLETIITDSSKLFEGYLQSNSLAFIAEMGFQLAFQFLSSPSLEKRIFGIQILKKFTSDQT